MLRCSLSVCPIILMWAYSMSSGKEVPRWRFSMIRVYLQCKELAWDPKSSSMRFGYSYFTGHEVFNLWFVKHMLIIVLALTLTIQDAYWWLVSTARWEPQEEGMMSTVASLPLVVKPRFNQTSRRKPNFKRWCLLASWHSGQWRQKTCNGVSSTNSNVKPAQHKQVLYSQLMMRLSISPICCKQRNERFEW
jgi:hypothetical protein